jgi:GNAT superfamily N-acetyltransferase
MCTDWMPALDLALSWDEFHRLPRNAAYKYEYLDGRAYLSPRPKTYHALLDLRTAEVAAEPVAGVAVRPVRESDWTELVPRFAATFGRIQPFGSLAEETRLEASARALERVRTGGDGPWIEPASFVAADADTDAPVGAILVTLLPDTDPCDWDSFRWPEPPPEDCVERRLGRPHLTWVFVRPMQAGEGIGTALLAAAVRGLRALGYAEMASTFLLGNESSMLWHWRNGFRLLPYPGSKRELRKRWSTA